LAEDSIMGKILRRIRRAKLIQKRQQEAQTTAPTQEQAPTQTQETPETTTQETPWEETLAEALGETTTDAVAQEAQPEETVAIEASAKTIAKIQSRVRQSKARKSSSKKTTTKTSEQ